MYSPLPCPTSDPKTNRLLGPQPWGYYQYSRPPKRKPVQNDPYLSCVLLYIQPSHQIQPVLLQKQTYPFYSPLSSLTRPSPPTSGSLMFLDQQASEICLFLLQSTWGTTGDHSISLSIMLLHTKSKLPSIIRSCYTKTTSFLFFPNIKAPLPFCQIGLFGIPHLYYVCLYYFLLKLIFWLTINPSTLLCWLRFSLSFTTFRKTSLISLACNNVSFSYSSWIPIRSNTGWNLLST